MTSAKAGEDMLGPLAPSRPHQSLLQQMIRWTNLPNDYPRPGLLATSHEWKSCLESGINIDDLGSFMAGPPGRYYIGRLARGTERWRFAEMPSCYP